MTRFSLFWARRVAPISLAVLSLVRAKPAAADPDDHVMVGAGVAALPTFQGSNDGRLVPVPIVDVEYWRFFVSIGDGLGVNLVDTPRFQAGVGVALMLGYREQDVPDGIGKLSSSAGGRVFVSWQFSRIILASSLVHALPGSDVKGWVASARLSYPLQVLDRLTLSPSFGVSWADPSYMRRYFGVNAEQAAASELAAYRPSSGFKDVTLRLAAFYGLTDELGLVFISSLVSNLDNVNASPFVESRWQSTGVLGMTYTF